MSAQQFELSLPDDNAPNPLWVPVAAKINQLNAATVRALSQGDFTQATALNRQLAEQVWLLRDITCHLRPVG